MNLILTGRISQSPIEHFLAFRRNLDGTYWYDLQMCRILADPNVGF